MAESDNSNCLKGYSYAEPEIQQFVKDFSKLILEDALIPQTDPNTKVLNFKQPLDLQKYLDLEIYEESIPREKLLELGKKVIGGSIVSGHPHFFNTMYTAIDPYSLFGAWLTEALNCNVHTYEVSPVMVTLENYIFKKISSVIGYPDGEGIFCPGSSFSNLTAIHLARFRYNSTLKEKGMFTCEPMTILKSEDAHYSIEKGASFLGFGTDNVVTIKTDDRGRIVPKDLEHKICQCKQNVAEFKHRRFNGKAAHNHLHFYKIVPAFQQEAKTVSITQQLVSEQQLSRYQRDTYKQLQGRLTSLWDQYEEDSIRTSDFLRSVGHLYAPPVPQPETLPESDSEDSDYESD
ncbi:Acidic amino acid decarboxylase GADL1 [Mytilus edulis]|uniref:Acidic amino acid decarboxylase GADL1 n=1 Tax=Mytilus edulis TaxID=6550 RepID=A0A8S3UGN9_MYTED|nr:Acidic amino acid decarboxylase GADL1 [Mytilus edulis]